MLILDDLAAGEGEALLLGADRLVWFGGLGVGAPQLDAYTQAEHVSAARDLLPSGEAWGHGGALDGLLAGMAGELARFDLRCQDLVAESVPPASDELLDGWERVVGVPDPCSPGDQGVEARRAAVWARWTGRATPTRAFFVALGRSLGVEVWVEEFWSADEALAADVPFMGDGWAFTWRVSVAAPAQVDYLTVGMDVGSPLATWGDPAVECAFRRHQPAHTVLFFAYRY